MKRAHIGALAGAGAALGLLVAVLGLPFGRMEYSAFAGLYHNGGTPAPGFHVALDCAVNTAGTQDACVVNQGPGSATVAVTAGNNTGVPADFGAWAFEVVNPDTGVISAPSVLGPPHASNPDFNDSYFNSANWNCSFPAPDNDNEVPDVPATQHSYLGCFLASGVGETFPASVNHVELARVTYNTVAGFPGGQTADLTLEDVFVTDSSGVELLSCNPVIINAGECFGATIEIFSGVGCVNDHDCDGYLNPPPPDHVAPVNTDTNFDNCFIPPNPDQQNNDGNWIDLTPPRAFDDITRPMSDGSGDRCDNDNDNDRLTGFPSEPDPPCASATGPTDSNNPDTDGDLALDGVECQDGTDPANAASKPGPATCGVTADFDGDGLPAGREYCYYGTSDQEANSDGDSRDDACEIASVNADKSVNVLDLQAVAGHFPTMAFGYHPNMDMNKDAVVNVLDLQFVAMRMTTCP
jgi:hypothetical protein